MSRIAAVLFVLLQPCVAFAAATVSLVAPYDHTIMREGPTRLVARVQNDNSGPVNSVEFRFEAPNDNYDFTDAQEVTVPGGWFISLFNNNRVIFTAGSAAARIPNGGSLDFTLWVQGNGGSAIPPASSDVRTERWNVVEVVHFGGPTDTLAGPTWTRHGFKLTLEATPATLATGGNVVVRYLVENRTNSNASKTNIASVPSAPAVTPAGAVTGPGATTPATLSLQQPNGTNVSAGEMSWTGTAQFAASGVTFRARVQDGSVGNPTSSPTVDSNPITIGNFTSILEVTPVTGISGATFDVKMTVTNHGEISLGNVRPSQDPAMRSTTLDPLPIGTATVAKVSGPTPSSVSTLGPGDSAIFRWQYTATGTLGQTVQFQGGAIANGTPNVTGLATSNAAEIAAISAYVTPDSIATNDSGPLTFALGNGTAFAFAEDFRFTFPAGFTVSAITPVAGYNGAISGGGTIVTYTRQNGGVLWDSGETLLFPMTFSSVPTTGGNSDQMYLVDARLVNLNEFHPIEVLVTENRLELALGAGTAADGNSTVSVTATLTNSSGNPLGGRTISFETTAGTLSSATAVTNGAGQATVTLTAPASSTDVTATVTATWYNTQDVGTVTFTGFTGANLLYIGGTLYARYVEPGDPAAFSIWVENVGTAAAVLTTGGTSFSFTCNTAPSGTATYTALLASPTTVAAGTSGSLAFRSQIIPATCDVSTDQAVNASFTYNPTRSISDSLIITASATFASVVGLAVEPWGEGVRLSWATELEYDNLGFRVLRADDAGEPEYLDLFVPSTGALFAEYEAFDPAPRAGLQAWWIEDVALDGSATRHGPVFLDEPDAVAVSPAVPLLAATRPELSADVWIDPLAPGDLRVLEHDETGITWEIVPPPFEVESVPWPVELRHRLRIPGYGVLQEYGLPDLPVRPIAIPLPPNTRAQVSVASIEETEHRDYRPTWWRGPSFAIPGIREERGLTPSGAARRAPRTSSYPARAVALADAGRAGDRAVSTLVVHPLRWREMDAVLVQTTRVVVRADFLPTAPAASAGPSAAERRQGEILAGPALVVRATRGGLVRVPVADLAAAGVDPSSAAVHRRAEPIPSRIEGDALLFVTGDFESPWSRERAFWIAPRSGPATVLPFEGTAPATGAAADLAGRRMHFEKNLSFGAEARQGVPEDRWLWVRAINGQTASVTLDVPAADGASPATLTVELQGLFDDPTALDEHRVRIALGGVTLGEVSLDAKQRTRASFAVPAGVVTAGSLTLAVTNLSTALSNVGLDSADLEWVAPADAAGGAELVVVALADGGLTAGGFAAAPAWAVDESDLAAPRLLPVSAAFDGASWLASVDVAAGTRVRFVTPADPGPATWSARPPHDPLVVGAGADWLAIAASPLVEALAGFAEYRATPAGGSFRTHVVDVADVYDLASFGDVDPAAVGRFLQLAAVEWPSPAPRYVLLAGDSDADPMNFLGLGVPPAMLQAPRLETSVLNVASDVSSAILDGDALPDLEIGRLSARDAADVEAVLAKTMAYESAPRDGWDARQVLLADDDLPEFDAVVAELAALLPAGMANEALSASNLGAPEAEARLHAAIAEGTSLVSYVGHGGVTGLGAESFLANADVASLGNERFPVVLAIDCMNGYFDHPFFDALAETLVRQPDAGAVAFFGSSAITSDAGHRDLALAFHHAFWREPGLRLGDVAARARAAVSWHPHADDLVGTFQLFGDPALRLNVNGTPVARASLVSVAENRAELSAAGSHDPDGDALYHRWEILGGDPSAVLERAESPEATLVGPAGRYRVRLTVADAHRAGPADELVVDLSAAAPSEGGGGGAGGFGCSVAATSTAAPAWLALAALLGLLARRRRA